jgi:hypothetical protein
VDNHFLKTGTGFKAGEGTLLQAKILISCAHFFNALTPRISSKGTLCFLLHYGILDLLFTFEVK